MKALIPIILIMLLSSTLTTAQSAKQKQARVEKKAAEERKRSFGGSKVQSVLKSEQVYNEPTVIALDKNAKETKTAVKQKAAANSSISGSSTSESGSPSILADEKGNGRDGTGNMQRSTPNIAGAEVPPGTNLYKKTSSERNLDAGKRVVKQEEQPAQVTTKNQPRETNATISDKRNDDNSAERKSSGQKAKSKKGRKSSGKDSGK